MEQPLLSAFFPGLAVLYAKRFAARSPVASQWKRSREPTVKRVLIFANPIAGRGKALELAERIGGALAARGMEARKVLCRPEEFAESDASQIGAVDAAVVIGGDGTLRAVAGRLMAMGEVPPLLFVAMGTANLMARHLGLRWHRATVDVEVAEAVITGKTRRLDAGVCNGELFLLMAGVGFDAWVVHELHRVRKGPISYGSYLLPTAMALVQYDFVPLRVIADGAEIFAAEPGLAFVGNVAEYGAGFAMVPTAKADDGFLDVCVLPCKNRMELLKWFGLAASGTHMWSSLGVFVRARRVRIETPPIHVPAPVQLDGDAMGHTPVEIDLLPSALPFIVTG
jgi:diacylglycerol kinase (ATP)